MERTELISNLLNRGVCSKGEIHGCSPEEIERFEKTYGLSLPVQYREFLLAVGHGAGMFLQGEDVFLSDLDDLKEAAIDLLEENSEEFHLPEDAFVFLMHQGYEFDYPLRSEGDDPPVYQYVEGNGPPVLTWESFSEFLSDIIDQHSRVIASCGG